MREMTRARFLGLMVFAYLFGIAARYIWIYYAQGVPDFFYNGQLMINTNDGYYFASGAQKALWGLHPENFRIPDVWRYGTVALTTLLAKWTPFSLETVILYLPVFVSSLVVVPIMLIGQLFGRPWWGFFSALLAVVGWSYYNRTMAGYYDTDMFSAMAPVFILYFLMKSCEEKTLKAAWFAALFIAVYPFLYDAGKTVVYAMGTLYALYTVWFHRKERVAWQSIVLVFAALLPLPVAAPWSYLVSLLLVTVLYGYFLSRSPSVRGLMIAAFVLFVGYLYFGSVITMVLDRIAQYVDRGTVGSGLHYYSVFQTIREAGHIPFEIFAKRIAGSVPGFVIAAIGYGYLLYRQRLFLLSLPLAAIGLFAWWGGLRFTVYAVPVAAMGAVFLLCELARMASKKPKFRVVTAGVLTAAVLLPNLVHIVEYKVPTVLNRTEVGDMARLNKVADSKDYTVAWWDYGYPLWFYSDTNTLIDGGKHQNDNFIVSKIFQTDSPALAARLARLAVETYAGGKREFLVVADKIFGKGAAHKDPNAVLKKLADGTYPLPAKSREIYFYLPYRMLSIFPTVMLFGNIDLTTGKPLRKTVFMRLHPVGQKGRTVRFAEGLVLNLAEGRLLVNNGTLPLSTIYVTQLLPDGKVQVSSESLRTEGLVGVFMKNYGLFLVMDPKTFRSTFIQMFVMGRYDPDYFEPVVVSPYTRIYRLRI